MGWPIVLPGMLSLSAGKIGQRNSGVKRKMVGWEGIYKKADFPGREEDLGGIRYSLRKKGGSDGPIKKAGVVLICRLNRVYFSGFGRRSAEIIEPC